MCVLLPPAGSSRQVDPYGFFDKLLTQIYLYQDSGPYIICGDFNARCSNDSDFIEGVDEVPERETVDFRKNSYGEIFLDFLIKSNCAMLNGRCDSKAEFTSVN